MGDQRSTPVQQALDEMEKLDTEDQEMVIDIVRQRLIERRRAEISRHARATLQAFREGRARYFIPRPATVLACFSVSVLNP